LSELIRTPYKKLSAVSYQHFHYVWARAPGLAGIVTEKPEGGKQQADGSGQKTCKEIEEFEVSNLKLPNFLNYSLAAAFCLLLACSAAFWTARRRPC